MKKLDSVGLFSVCLLGTIFYLIPANKNLCGFFCLKWSWQRTCFGNLLRFFSVLSTSSLPARVDTTRPLDRRNTCFEIILIQFSTKRIITLNAWFAVQKNIKNYLCSLLPSLPGVSLCKVKMCCNSVASSTIVLAGIILWRNHEVVPSRWYGNEIRLAWESNLPNKSTYKQQTILRILFYYKRQRYQKSSQQKH